MPHMIPTDNRSSTDFGDVKHDYKYPEDLDFNPKSDLHKKIKNEILKRARESSLSISSRHSSWRAIDRTLTTYIELDSKEEDVKSADDRKPVSVVFPYSYAILETILSYLVAAFFQEPILRFEGVSPEDTVGAIMMEKVIHTHCNKSKVALGLHTMFRDSLSYGFGIVSPGWDRKYGFRTIKKPRGFISQVSNLFTSTGGFEKDVEEVTLFEGNTLSNIDPYLCLPDSNVSIHDVQEGEFFGWLDKTNLMNLLSDERHSDDDIFNVKYVKSVHNKRTSVFAIEGSDREIKYGSAIKEMSLVSNPVDVIRMMIKLIPKEWKLGKSEYPERWMFALAADDVVIEARPLDLNHNMFPVAVSAPDFDGYSSCPVSRLEVLYGLQGILDWLFNAHIANVRKAINDMLVVDPYSINVKDLTDPKPGKIIRTRRPVWGKGVKDFVQQLAVNDVTKQHIADSSWIVNWMQKVGAADDASMGALRQGGPERLTGQEFQGTRAGAFSRLERMARVIGLQAMQDIGYMFASHAQQMMEEELYVTTTGRWQETLMNEYGSKFEGMKNRMKVTPFDILIDYDVMIRDGSIPGNNFSEVWIRMFETMMKYPELAQQFDIGRIFKHIARNSGAKNVDEFVRINVRPDEEVEREAEAGNIAPTEEALRAI